MSRGSREYRVVISPKAEKQLASLPVKAQDAIVPKLRALADDPRPRGVKKMRGRVDTYRTRSGDYRIVYEIHDKVLLVLIIEVGDRKDVFKRG